MITKDPLTEARPPQPGNGDDAVLQEEEDREPLLGDLLAYQWLQQRYLVDARAKRSAQHLGGIQPASGGGTAGLVPAAPAPAVKS